VSKAQYITAMTLSILLMLGAVVLALSSLDTLRKADEKGNVVVRGRGGKAELPAHFAVFFPPTVLFLMGLGFAYMSYRFYHDE
jgi:divalent metal cation (Fe/Co/Zn/Cd) transporter